jgi:hypothetical protein
MIYLIHCKNLCKYHHVPLPIKTIKGKKKRNHRVSCISFSLCLALWMHLCRITINADEHLCNISLAGCSQLQVAGKLLHLDEKYKRILVRILGRIITWGVCVCMCVSVCVCVVCYFYPNMRRLLSE